MPNRLLLASTLVLLAVSVCIFSLRIGSVAKLSSQGIDSATSLTLPPSLKLLAGASKWAAGNGTMALYVDWKDNWLAHHSADGVNWGPWPAERALDVGSASRLLQLYDS